MGSVVGKKISHLFYEFNQNLCMNWNEKYQPKKKLRENRMYEEIEARNRIVNGWYFDLVYGIWMQKIIIVKKVCQCIKFSITTQNTVTSTHTLTCASTMCYSNMNRTKNRINILKTYLQNCKYNTFCKKNNRAPNL